MNNGEQGENDAIEGEVTDITVRSAGHITDYVPSFAIQLNEAAERLEQFKQFIRDQMIDGEDFGKIPGIEKPTLLQPGAQKLCNIFGFAPTFQEVRVVENWDEGFFYYCFKCSIVNKRTGLVEADCEASANSLEERYRWRTLERKCPECGERAIILGKEEYGGGGVCWKKRDGCNAKFDIDDERITSQKVERIPNPEPYTLVNTLQKIAQKRSLVGATLIATRGSGIFTQDVEDMGEALQTDELPKQPSKTQGDTTMPFGKHKGKTVEQIYEEDPQYVQWAAENMDNKEWQGRFKSFLDSLDQVKEESDDFITIGNKKYRKGDKINQAWFEKLQRRVKEAGMVQAHLANHIKKHYNAERLPDLTYEQAIQFGQHLNELIEAKKNDTDDDYQPYSLNEKLIERGNALDIEEWDFGTWYTVHVVQKIPPTQPVQGPIEEAVEQFITQLEAGESVEAMTKVFDEELQRIIA